MRVHHALVILGLGLCGPGCALLTDSANTLFRSVADEVDDACAGLRNWRWAEQAWQEVGAAGPGAHSDDYARGFKSGFADYLDMGGSGEPPVVAPPRYRGWRYQTPQGYQAIQEWFAGYRHGAEAARHSGVRQWITGPTSLRGPGAAAGVVVLTPTPPASLGLPIPGEAAPDELPPPQPVPPEQADESLRPALQLPVPGDEGPVLIAAPGTPVPIPVPDKGPVMRPVPAAPVPISAAVPVFSVQGTFGVPEAEAPPAPRPSKVVLPVIVGPGTPAPAGGPTKARLQGPVPATEPAAPAPQTLVLSIPPAAVGPDGERRGPVLGPARGDE